MIQIKDMEEEGAKDMKYAAFISYSRKNKDAVLLIKDEIERTLGLKCWMDLEGIESGSREFTQDIIDAIDTSTAFLFFLSTSSQESEWALKEIDFAISENKHVALVRFNADPMTKKFRFEFGRTDVIDWRASDQKGKLLRDLRRWSDNGERSSISSPGAASTLVICLVCGKKNDPKDTFKCRKCGKDDLCLRHQDQETFLCAECAAAQRRVHVGAKSKLCCSEIPFIKKDKKGMRHVRKVKNSDVVQSPVPCDKSEQQSSKRKTTIIGAAGCMSECAAYIQQIYHGNGYGTQRIPFEERGDVGIIVQVRNSTTTAGSVLRAAVGMNCCATLKLTAAGDDLVVEVIAGTWIDKVCVAVVSWFVLGPFFGASVLGAYRQKRLLDNVFKDAVEWFDSKKVK